MLDLPSQRAKSSAQPTARTVKSPIRTWWARVSISGSPTYALHPARHGHAGHGSMRESRRHRWRRRDRKSTRLNSSHVKISYAVFCLKKKIKIGIDDEYSRK